MKRKYFSFLGVVIAVCAITLIGVYKNAASGAATVEWISKQPNLAKSADLTALPAIANYDCSIVNLRVKRGFQLVNEQHCTVPTSMGLMEQEGKVVQAPGYSEAYQIKTSGTVVPIPGQPSALSMRGNPFGPGVTYELYKYFYNHVTFDNLSTDPKFTVTKPPENIFRYGDGQSMQFNPYTLTFPDAGRFMVVDTIYNGFMIMDTRTLIMRPIAPSLVRANGTELLRAATAVDNNGRFAAIAYGAPGSWGTPYFKVIDVAACNTSFNSNSLIVPAFTCPTADLRPYLEQQIPGLLSIRNVRFTNDRTITFSASSGSPTAPKYAKYTMVAGGQELSVTKYLALGDSYISGEGAYGYKQETDTERNRCHQSVVSYPYLLATSFESGLSVACSGAKIHNLVEPVHGTLKKYQIYDPEPTALEEENAANQYTPGFIFQAEFVENDNPEAITISIGGNDIGFGQVLERCVHPLKGMDENIESQHTCYPTYEDRLELVNLINRQLPRLRALYAEMRNSGPQTRRVYVVGYPQVAKVGGDCGTNVQLNSDEVKLASDLVAYLNSVIAQAAREAGVQYVDTQQAFDGRRLCEGDGSLSAMNGFTVNQRAWGGVGFAESFHPNKAGHQLLAQSVAQQTQSLTKPMPDPMPQAPYQPVDPNLPILQNAPVSNRPDRHVQMLERGEPLVERGGQLDLIINAQTYSTKPDSVYEASLRSTPVSLGSFRSDASGNLSVTATIPANTEAGFHTIHVQGSDIFGKPIDLQQTMYITASGEDFDGDGIHNNADSCAFAGQSGIDRDADGTDDACDALIGAAPVIPEEPAGIIWRDDAVLSIEIQTTSGQ